MATHATIKTSPGWIKSDSGSVAESASAPCSGLRDILSRSVHPAAGPPFYGVTLTTAKTIQERWDVDGCTLSGPDSGFVQRAARFASIDAWLVRIYRLTGSHA